MIMLNVYLKSSVDSLGADKRDCHKGIKHVSKFAKNNACLF